LTGEDEAAPAYVVDHCDVLLVVWDGRRVSDGGGTANAVRRARRRGLPVAWVHCGNAGRKSGAAAGKGPGSVTFERFERDGRR
jgi:hypothetical protein